MRSTVLHMRGPSSGPLHLLHFLPLSTTNMFSPMCQSKSLHMSIPHGYGFLLSCARVRLQMIKHILSYGGIAWPSEVRCPSSLGSSSLRLGKGCWLLLSWPRLWPANLPMTHPYTSSIEMGSQLPEQCTPGAPAEGAASPCSKASLSKAV